MFYDCTCPMKFQATGVCMLWLVGIPYKVTRAHVGGEAADYDLKT
jgi:hypothetical protein